MSAETSDHNQNKQWKSVVEAKSYYNRHFPTDKKTFNLRLPFAGLMLSILTFSFVTTFVCDNYFRRQENNLVKYCYVFAAAGVSYELYYGLEIGDRKQYTPWIILKSIEVLLSVIAIIYGFVDNRRNTHIIAGDMVFGFIVLFLNGAVGFLVLRKSMRQFYGSSKEVDENIYDNCANYDNP